MFLELHPKWAQISHIHLWLVVNRAAYGESLRLLFYKLKEFVDMKTPFSPTALIVDTLRLHALEPERLEAAKDIAKDIELDYECMTLVMVRKDLYIYGINMDDSFEHDAIAVDAEGDGYFTLVYSFNNGKETFYYLPKDLEDWRYRYFDAATSVSESCGGGGGSAPDNGWGKKDDEDERTYARRCLQMAHSMCKPKSIKRGFHR